MSAGSWRSGSAEGQTVKRELSTAEKRLYAKVETIISDQKSSTLV